MSNYRNMTSHKAKAKPKPKNKDAPRSPVSERVPTVPDIGQRIAISPIMIFQDEDDAGKPKTPMSKMRYFPDTKEWRQVGRSETGMFFFFTNDPDATHTACIVQSIIPSGTGCYAELVA